MADFTSTIAALDHYTKIAPLYDKFNEHVYDERAEIAVRWLDLSPTDKLADIGAGTGAIASLIWKKAGLSSPVLAVEPCLDMLKKAEKREGVVTMLATFNEFLESDEVQKYNKFLLVGSVHHIPQLLATFKALYNKISQDSQVLIVDYPEFFLWKHAKETALPLTFVDETESYLKDAGFTVRRDTEEIVHIYSKNDVFEWIRQKWFSVLSTFTDKEIEEGITELSNTVFKGVTSRKITDKYFLIKGTKDNN